MKALIVGADKIEGLKTEIQRYSSSLGISDIDHWTGRKVGECRKQVSRNTALVIFMCDRANHMLVKSVRKQAELMGVPMIFCRHSAAELREHLQALINPCTLCHVEDYSRKKIH